MLIMVPLQEMSHVQNISSITIIAKDILYNKLVQHINLDLKSKVTKYAKTLANAQNKEDILPVATLSIAIYVSSKSRSRRDVTRGVGCCRRHHQPQLIASTSKSRHRASNALQQDKISIL